MQTAFSTFYFNVRKKIQYHGEKNIVFCFLQKEGLEELNISIKLKEKIDFLHKSQSWQKDIKSIMKWAILNGLSLDISLEMGGRWRVVGQFMINFNWIPNKWNNSKLLILLWKSTSGYKNYSMAHIQSPFLNEIP